MSIKILDEMSYNKSMASDKCEARNPKFIEHFDKVYKNPNDENVNHWIEEMSALWEYVKKLTLKPSARHLSKGELWDWFFIGYSDPDKLFDTDDEKVIYEEFCFTLMSSDEYIGDVLKRILKIGK